MPIKLGVEPNTITVKSDCQFPRWLGGGLIVPSGTASIREPKEGCTCDVCEENRKRLHEAALSTG